MNADHLPGRLARIVEEFSWCERDEKLELLLSYSQQLPPFPERLRNQHKHIESVPECVTPVSLIIEWLPGAVLHFDVPPEAPTVRGYAAILAEGLAGCTPDQILQVPSNFYLEMGLQDLLTPQRLHGLTALLAHIKHLASERKAEEQSLPTVAE